MKKMEICQVREDKSFTILAVKKLDLQITLPQTKMDSPEVMSFVKFAQRFCFNAGWIDVNKDYMSANGKYKIEYLPYIVSSKTGQKMQTPARISTKDGRIPSFPRSICTIYNSYAYGYSFT